MEINGIEFLDAVKIIDPNAIEERESNKGKYIPVKRKSVRSVRLPLNQEPQPIDKIKTILDSCERITGNGEFAYITNRAQVLIVTDLNLEPITLALTRGSGQELNYLDKRFIYGGCICLGNMSQDLILVKDWASSAKLHYKSGFNVVCYLESLNFRFIYPDLIKLNSNVKILCHSKSEVEEVDGFFIEQVWFNEVGKTINVESWLEVN